MLGSHEFQFTWRIRFDRASNREDLPWSRKCGGAGKAPCYTLALPDQQSVTEKLQRRIFGVIARTCFFLYGHFPFLGTLDASIAIIGRDGLLLVVNRADGRGLCFPGGLALRKEDLLETLRREVLEETGLKIEAAEWRLKYFSNYDILCNTNVYEVVVSGEERGSWEGLLEWVTLEELQQRLMVPQRPVLEYLVGRRNQSGN